MLDQVVLVLEGLVADLALMRTLACNGCRDLITLLTKKMGIYDYMTVYLWADLKRQVCIT